MNERNSTTHVINTILIDLLLIGVVVTSLMAPGFGKVLDLPFFNKPKYKKFSAKDQRKLVQYMKRQKLVELSEKDDGQHLIKITKKGKLRAQKAKIGNLYIPTPKKWDQRWRMVIFDIPEDKKAVRNNYAGKLKELGFYNLQRSVWVHPFICEREIEVLNDYYDVGQFVTVAEVVKIDQHKDLTEKFRNLVLK